MPRPACSESWAALKDVALSNQAAFTQGPFQRESLGSTDKLLPTSEFFPMSQITLWGVDEADGTSLRCKMSNTSWFLIATDTDTCKHRSFLCALARSNRIAKGQTVKNAKTTGQLAAEHQQTTGLQEITQMSVTFGD